VEGEADSGGWTFGIGIGSRTVQDAARLAKVSAGSVSRVLNELNGRDEVAPEIRETVTG
jgi:LacI family transcriptional regulator